MGIVLSKIALLQPRQGSDLIRSIIVEYLRSGYFVVYKQWISTY